MKTAMTVVKQDMNIFVFNDSKVPVLIDDLEKPWFSAKAVCASLGIQWQGAGKTLRNMPKHWLMVGNLPTIQGGRDAYLLSEAGVYRLAFRSNKPEAEKFSEWVCEEVLPEIRRTGHFGTPSYSQEIQLRNQLLKLMDRLKTEKDSFKFEVLLYEFKKVCRQLGTPVPDLKLLGEDLSQKRLEGVA